jgi:hypothetical protein
LRELKENSLREIVIISRKEVHRCGKMFPERVSLFQKLDLGAVRFPYETKQFKLPEKIRIHGDTTAIPVHTTTLEGRREPEYNTRKNAVY